MEIKENKWALGETATLVRDERLLKKGRITSYGCYIESRYVCIREEASGLRGILMKVLGKTRSDQIRMVGGEPFCKDDAEKLSIGTRYFSYSFPSAHEVMEALGILRANRQLLLEFEKASMPINPDSTFWVSDTERSLLFRKKPQYVGGRDGQLYPAGNSGPHDRVTFVYFYKNNLNW